MVYSQSKPEQFLCCSVNKPDSYCIENYNAQEAKIYSCPCYDVESGYQPYISKLLCLGIWYDQEQLNK